MQRGAELHAEAFETRVGDPHESLDFDQIECAARIFARRKEGANQPEGRKGPDDPAATYVRRGLGREQDAILTGFLLHPAADREGAGTDGTGVAPGAER